ncbi:hypothetical protein NMK71_11570 [Weeksellaceae bacterium KMM 9713]|uniref:Uncharacterized protein n=1 Tax=Profundicola chukchiensis TaxID=2961959 RepID=A0A9X4N1I3_9FLAO|nr:hypothetical protein [Profundicola chukchiensis]MDG4947051.1 hypothetical protein [Profundicola chukchiensis]
MMKKILFSYLKKIPVGAMLVSGLFMQPLLAQEGTLTSFPYEQSFMSGTETPKDFIAIGDVTFSNQGMLLTPAGNNKNGVALLDGISFASGDGIKIEFEFGIWGGTSTNEYPNGGDGLSVFLYDGSLKAENDNDFIGTYGEGLGYTYRRTNNNYSNERKGGLKGAYLGIALDPLGYFHQARFKSYMRKNGVQDRGDQPGLTTKTSQVTLRGGIGQQNNDLNIGAREPRFNGYPVLFTRTTETNEGSRLMAKLKEDGDFYYFYNDKLDNNFKLNTDSLGINPSDNNYRKAFIELVPNPEGGYNITVKIQHGAIVTTVINNYHYKTQTKYQENALPVGKKFGTDFNILDDRSPTTSGAIGATLNTSPPETFKIGFGGATGRETNNHLIRNLKVEILYAAEAEDDEANLSCEESVEIAVLKNDVAYANPLETPSSENLDKTSFRFIAADGSIVTTIPYFVEGEGSWFYDSGTGFVTFSPVQGFEGPASIKYDINGNVEPYNSENHRALPATITVNVGRCVCTVEGASGEAQDASVGISTLNRNSNTWLENVKQGVNLVLESSTKPFVITRVINVSSITEPVEGMLVWETSTSSLKLYKASGWSTLREGCNKPVLRTNQ